MPSCGCNSGQHHPTDCLQGLAQSPEGRAELRRQIRALGASARKGLTTPQIAKAERAHLRALLSQEGAAHA